MSTSGKSDLKSQTAQGLEHSLPGKRPPGPSNLRAQESSTPDIDSSSAQDPTPSSEANQSSQSILVSSSFTLDDSCIKDFPNDNREAKDTTTKEIKAKRSFRDIFHKREIKPTEKLPKPAETKQPSMAGSTLARRFRNSTNFSKVTLPRVLESKAQRTHESDFKKDTNNIVTKDTERQAALSSLEATSSSLVTEIPPVIRYDTTTVINKIIDRVTSLPSDSPDRLRGLEIAEAVLHAVECSKEVKLSAEKARKHARDAELNAGRVTVELERLHKLCKADFDGETLTTIKELIKSVGCVVGEKAAESAVLSM
ncbi:hypothetical protein P153DRAFT_397892 [Dothidotthia symphoricarpi CBS 119687]|uniref:Uncharacterized protein n=1 Tax=Dothidotthia symphoricarpi CBS 119687 TaxID=1392245 RepID=A0A6A6A850_9PLEO|nr:uncharacterized protein P153DRAFT_397892 [Dothidotthia symphoricarpi CBS 119687]KAF2128010.1 hypothetical protein P153DRAFT_397892 [Dothidotthia symphoricarpi CBS 119687]